MLEYLSTPLVVKGVEPSCRDLVKTFVERLIRFSALRTGLSIFVRLGCRFCHSGFARHSAS